MAGSPYGQQAAAKPALRWNRINSQAVPGGATCRVAWSRLWNRTDDLFFPDHWIGPAASTLVSAAMIVFTRPLGSVTDRSRPHERDETCHKRGNACRVRPSQIPQRLSGRTLNAA